MKNANLNFMINCLHTYMHFYLILKEVGLNGKQNCYKFSILKWSDAYTPILGLSDTFSKLIINVFVLLYEYKFEFGISSKNLYLPGFLDGPCLN